MLNEKKPASQRLSELDDFAIEFESAVLDLMWKEDELTESELEKEVHRLECWLHDTG